MELKGTEMSELEEIELRKLETFVLARPLCARLDEQHTTDMQKKVQEAAEQEPGLAVFHRAVRLQADV